MHKGGHNADFLLHALAHLLDSALGVNLKPLQQLLHSAAVREAPVLSDEGEILVAPHLVKEADLSWDIPQVLLNLDRLTPAVVPGNGAAAAAGLDEAHQVADGGGLSRAVGAQEAEHLPLPYVHGQVKDPFSSAVVPGQMFDPDDTHRYSSLYNAFFSSSRSGFSPSIIFSGGSSAWSRINPPDT